MNPATDPHALSAEMPFIGISAKVSDFWLYALGDSRTNNLRGYLAEFLVREAVRSTSPKVEWDSYDVIDPLGITIEVKSIGYVQAWAASELPLSSTRSKPPAQSARFTGLRSKKLLSGSEYAKEATYNADVYVFCEETEKSDSQYRPLDISQWTFYVLGNKVVADTKQKSISITRVKELAGQTAYADLASAITLAAQSTPV